MKVLMISGDPWVLESGSDTAKRMEELMLALGELYIVPAYGSAINFIKAFFECAKILKNKKIEIITAQGAEHAAIAWILSGVYKTPWQMQIHTDIMSPYFWQESFKNKIRVMLVKFLLPRADCVRAVSNRIKRSLIKLNKNLDKPDKITVLPVFVDIEKIKNAPIKTDLHKKYPGRFIILMASRITKEKNIGLALEVMREIVTHPLTPSLTVREGDGRRVNPLLLIIGDGPELEALKFEAYEFSLNDNVVFEPRADDLISYYKTCDLFLLTSNYEGYGRTLVEAAASGAKIISSDVGIAPEILEKECVFKIGGQEDLKQKLLLALGLRLPPPKPLSSQTKEEYLKLYKNSLDICQV